MKKSFTASLSENNFDLLGLVVHSLVSLPECSLVWTSGSHFPDMGCVVDAVAVLCGSAGCGCRVAVDQVTATGNCRQADGCRDNILLSSQDTGGNTLLSHTRRTVTIYGLTRAARPAIRTLTRQGIA